MPHCTVRFTTQRMLRLQSPHRPAPPWQHKAATHRAECDASLGPPLNRSLFGSEAHYGARTLRGRAVLHIIGERCCTLLLAGLSSFQPTPTCLAAAVCSLAPALASHTCPLP